MGCPGLKEKKIIKKSGKFDDVTRVTAQIMIETEHFRNLCLRAQKNYLLETMTQRKRSLKEQVLASKELAVPLVKIKISHEFG